jgi:hypothetical protein
LSSSSSYSDLRLHDDPHSGIVSRLFLFLKNIKKKQKKTPTLHNALLACATPEPHEGVMLIAQCLLREGKSLYAQYQSFAV